MTINNSHKHHFDDDLLLEDATETLKEPPEYAVIMLNDDYTPMDFVVAILMGEFHHEEAMAVKIMLDIHHTGCGIAGVYSRDIAETKANHVNVIARNEGYPLTVVIDVVE